MRANAGAAVARAADRGDDVAEYPISGDAVATEIEGIGGISNTITQVA